MHDFGAPLALPWRHNPNYLDGKQKGVGGGGANILWEVNI